MKKIILVVLIAFGGSAAMATKVQDKIKIKDNSGYQEISLDLIERAEINIKEMNAVESGFEFIDLTRHFSGGPVLTTLLQNIDLTEPFEVNGSLGCAATGGLTLHFRPEANISVKVRSFSFLGCRLMVDHLFPRVVYRARSLDERWLRHKIGP